MPGTYLRSGLEYINIVKIGLFLVSWYFNVNYTCLPAVNRNGMSFYVYVKLLCRFETMQDAILTQDHTTHNTVKLRPHTCNLNKHPIDVQHNGITRRSYLLLNQGS